MYTKSIEQFEAHNTRINTFGSSYEDPNVKISNDLRMVDRY